MSNELPTTGNKRGTVLIRTPDGLKWGHVGPYPYLVVKDMKPIWSDGHACDIEGLPPAKKNNDVFQILDDSGKPMWSPMMFTM